jgi:recombination protein RecA
MRRKSPSYETEASSQEATSQILDSARRAVLDKAAGDLLKRYGEGSIMSLGEARHMQTEAFPTGSLSLDIALGIGGIPRGRITEIFGPEGSGNYCQCDNKVTDR